MNIHALHANLLAERDCTYPDIRKGVMWVAMMHGDRLNANG
jgi:hypothetical protein